MSAQILSTQNLDPIGNLFVDLHYTCLDALIICSNRGPEQPNRSLLPSNEMGCEKHTKSKKKRKERTKEGKTLESDGVNHNNALKDHKSLQDKADDEKPATNK